MQSLTYQQNTRSETNSLISTYQDVPRNTSKLTRVRDAVRAWNKATPGAAQEHISQLVASEWMARGGRGLLLAGSKHNTKQNFFRMINDPGPKNDKSLMQLIPVIESVMGRDNPATARQFGFVVETDADVLAGGIKECSDAHQAKLLSLPIKQLEKEVGEAVAAVLRYLPTDSIGPVLASLATMMPGFM